MNKFKDYEVQFTKRGYAIWSWYKHMAPIGKYCVAILNYELAAMQCAEYVHPICVMDDFGNLVRVA